MDALRERLVAGLASGTSVDPALAGAARRLSAIDPTRLGAGGLRLQLELALLEPAIARATAAPVYAPAAAAGAAARIQPVPAGSDPAKPVAAPDKARVARGPDVAAPGPLVAADAPEQPVTAPAATRSDPTGPVIDAPGPGPEPAVVSQALNPAGGGTGPGGDDLERLRNGWPGLVEQITLINRAVRPLIVDCRPIGVEGNVVTLGFPEEKAFLKDVAERRRPILEQAFSQYLDHPVGVRCVATNLDLMPPLPADADAAHLLSEAHRIFADDLADTPEVT